ELQLDRFTHRKITVNRRIPLRCAEPAQEIPGNIPLPKCLPSSARRISECSRIQRLSAGELRPKQVKRLPWNQVRTHVSKNTAERRKQVVTDIYRRRGMDLYGVLQRPAAQNRPEPGVLYGSGNLVRCAGRKGMAYIEI